MVKIAKDAFEGISEGRKRNHRYKGERKKREN